MNKILCPNSALSIILFLVLFTAASGSSAVSAQSGFQARLEKPDFSGYPVLKTYLDVFAEDGGFVSGLTSSDVQLLENDQPRKLLEFQELNPGIQLVLAVNIAPPFAIQDDTGTSRWGYLSAALSSWAGQEPLNGSDDLSLITNDGWERAHLREWDLLAAALNRYRPQPRETASNLNVLARAVEIASDPTPELGMKRILILLTPPPSPEDVAALESLTSLALENDVRVYPWLVSSPAYFNSTGSEQLQAMAEKTGGEFFTFSGPETIPDLESEFQKLRGTYLLEFVSGINTSGSHRLEAVVSYQDQEIPAAREFPLTILPPNLILISPPQELIRENPRPEQEDYPVEAYQPQTYQLEAIIEFPDNLPRPIEKTVLRVDGEIEDTNQSPPFDTFLWDLSKYTESGTHYISIEIQDAAGLNNLSIRTPIEIHVDQPALPFSSLITKNTLPLLGLLAVILAFGVIFMLIVRGVIRPREVIGQNGDPKSRKHLLRSSPPRDQASSSVPTEGEESPSHQMPPFAYLIPEEEPAEGLFDSYLPVFEQEITFGSDPSSAIIALADPSVAKLHARLIKVSDEAFELEDEGSETGTWVNYKQLNPNQSGLIKEGDLVHFGRVGFRIQTTPPAGGPETDILKEHEA